MSERALQSTAASLAPVAPSERIGALDVLRGWAMFGVLWSNLNGGYGALAPTTPLDRALLWTQHNLLESRFYSLLILLFGVGFGIQLVRAQTRGVDVRDTYYRRSAALLAVGVIHGTLIWNGDILTIYALTSFALVMFRNTGTRGLLVAAALCFFIGPALMLEARQFAGLQVPAFGNGQVSDTFIGHLNWWHLTPIRVENYTRWLARWGLTSYMSILASFLVGLWLVKTQYLRRVLEDPRTTRRVLLVSLVAATVGYTEWVLEPNLWPPMRPPADNMPHFPYPYFQLSMLRLVVLRFFTWDTEGTAIAYACVILLIWQQPWGRRLLQPLAAAGRMALTTYLTQSIVCQFLFMGMGLSWSGSVGYTRMLVVTLVLFSVQMAASTWWLRRFRYGPAEWVWRTLTYGRPPEMRPGPSLAAA